MNTQETLKSDAIRFVNTIAKAKKMLTKKYSSLEEENIYGIGLGHGGWTGQDVSEVQMSGVIRLAHLIGADIVEVEWAGNESCNSNYMEVYFLYKGIKFFELIDKIDLIKSMNEFESSKECVNDERK